jgi:paraquat-inducible protein B
MAMAACPRSRCCPTASVRWCDGSAGKVDVTLKQLNSTLAQADKTLATASRAMLALQARSDTTLAAVTRLAENGNATLERTGPELQRTLDSAREASAAAAITLTRINDMTAAGSPTREDLDAALRDLGQAARGMRAYVELLEDQPNAVIFGDRRP